MRKQKRWMQLVILLGIVIVAGFTIVSGLSDKHEIPKTGDEAPDFTLGGLDGKKHSLSDYKGKYILINFWGSFCPPCVAEMPAIQKQYDKYKNKNFVVLGVNLNESTVAVQGFVRQYNISFPIVLDKDEVRKTYGVNSYPSSFFVDPDGKIFKMKQGEMTETFIENTLADLFKK